MQCDLHLAPPRNAGPLFILSGSLHVPHRAPLELRYEIPIAYAAAATDRADPFLIAFLFPLIQAAATCTVHAPVSASLLPNLDRFMQQWHAWFPRLYHRATIRALHLVHDPPAAVTDRQRTIVPFSCGLDSTFTLFRHHQRLLGEKSRRISAAMLLSNFDIRLTDQRSHEKFDRLVARCQGVLAPAQIPLIPINSNFRTLPTNWLHSNGTQLISSLHVLSAGYAGALVPNSISNRYLTTPWCTHPLTDPLLSSEHFSVFDDGAEHVRLEKIKILGQFPNGFDHLRVCNARSDSIENCCGCEKCIITILGFRLAGLSLPATFAHDPTDAEIHRLPLNPQLWAESWRDILREIQAQKLQNVSWARAVRSNFRRHRPRWMFEKARHTLKPARGVIRYLCRGSTLSNRERSLQLLTNQPA